MTIDINELRRKLQSDDLIDRIDIHANVKPVLTELLDRLESAEKERDSYKFAFIEYSEKTEWVQRGVNDGTVSAKYLGWHRADVMSDLLSAAESDALEQARLNGIGSEREAALVAKLEAAEKERDRLKELDSRRCAALNRQVIYNARLAEENDALRAKIEAMEQQEPVGKFIRHPSNGLWEQDGYDDNPDAGPLYALPGAQPKLDEIKIALQRALELGKRETWTGARKYRSREDQCEEQQCWDKVWTLLDAKGE